MRVESDGETSNIEHSTLNIEYECPRPGAQKPRLSNELTYGCLITNGAAHASRAVTSWREGRSGKFQKNSPAIKSQAI